jgi:hypothetical protein
MLEGFGISAQGFKNFQVALGKATELVTERMVDKEEWLMDSESEEKEKEPLLTISSIRILQGN